MKKFLLMIAAVPLASALAQDPAATNSHGANGSSWTGLLVAAGCSGSAAAPTEGTTDTSMARGTPTPAREQNTTYEDRAKQADRSSTGSSAAAGRKARRTDRGASVDDATPAITDPVTTPAVDDKGTRGSSTKNTPSTTMQGGGNPTDRSCYIGQGTTAFALKLKDGRMVHFDDAGNAKIARQLQTGDRLHDKVKTFRATVKGEMQGETIVVDSIQM